MRSGACAKAAHWTTCSCFEGSFELCRLRFGNAEVGASECRPLFRRSRVRFQHVGDREPRPECGAIAAVECEHFAGRGLVQSQGHLTCNAGSYPWSAKSLALEAEIGNFVERIDRTQPRAELETIDDLRGLAQPDVLRSQVAMPIHDTLCAHALGKQRASAFKKQTLRTVDAPNHSARQVEPWIKQDLVIDGHISLPLAQMQCRRKE